MLESPDLCWDEDGTPRSSRFDDVYCSRYGGLSQSTTVFLEAHRLPERWAGHFQQHRHFTLAECGFGMGLNFLLCMRAFLEQATAPHSCLHYYAAEAFPLSGAELAQIHRLWPELAPYAEALRAVYPSAVPGFHRRVLAGGRIRLTLLFGDAASLYGQLYSAADGVVDAWLLDGFCPKKNPAMWSEALFAQLARLSRPEASVASYSSAGAVMRGLKAAGFEVETIPGWPHKRHYLRGVFRGAPSKHLSAPWFRWPQPKPAVRHATIIGGGLAGTSTAYALAERGWHVTLLERHAALAQEASGNLVGALYPHLHPQPTPTTRLFLAAYLYALSSWQQRQAAGTGIVGAQAGVALLAHDAARQQALEAVLQGLALPEEVLRRVRPEDLPLATPYGLLFPEGGWQVPASVCEAFVQHPGITVKTHETALRWEYQDGQWRVFGDDGVVLSSSPVLVLATGSAALDAPWSRFLPLDAIRGQVSHVPANPLSAPLKTVLCYEGYLTPAHNGQHCLGASFERGCRDPEPTQREHRDNHAKLARILPTLAASFPENTEGRVAYRLSCRDHLPIVGPLPEVAAFETDYRELARGFPPERYPAGQYQPGLYVHIAHGSRGLTTAPLCAELLADLIEGTPLPLPSDLVEALCPARFLIRDLQKKKLPTRAGKAH